MSRAPKSRQPYLIPQTHTNGSSEQPSGQQERRRRGGQGSSSSPVDSPTPHEHDDVRRSSLNNSANHRFDSPHRSSEALLFTNGLDPERFYMPTNIPSVAQIIQRRGGVIVDDINDSTVIVITNMQANWGQFRERIARERGDGPQPVLKDSWVIQCDEQDEQVELDPYLVSVEAPTLSEPNLNDSRTAGSATQPKLATGRRRSDVSGIATTMKEHSESSSKKAPRHSTGSFRMSEVILNAKNDSSPGDVDSTKSRKQVMEDTLVDLWARHGQEWRQDQIYAELDRRFPDMPENYFRRLRQAKKDQLDARILSARSTMATDSTPKTRRSSGNASGILRRRSSERPSRSTRVTEKQSSDEGRSMSRTPSPPSDPPEERSKGKFRFSTPETEWASAIIARRLQQDPSTAFGDIAKELCQHRDAHPIRSWQNQVSKLATALMMKNGSKESRQADNNGHWDLSSSSESEEALDSDNLRADVRARHPRITREDEQWMLDLFRRLCELDPSISDADFANELAKKRPMYSLESWKSKVTNNAVSLVQIRREIEQAPEGIPSSPSRRLRSQVSSKATKPSSSENESESEQVASDSDGYEEPRAKAEPPSAKKTLYTADEDENIARFISGYPPAERFNPFIWETFHMKHPHRTAAAYREHYRQKRDVYDHLANRVRTWPVSSEEGRDTSENDDWPQDDSVGEEAEVENVVLKKDTTVKRSAYQQWELDAMAEHLSNYGPGASGQSVWKDFAAQPEHSHRTLVAWTQAHSNKMDYINEKAAKLRRMRLRAHRSGGQNDSENSNDQPKRSSNSMARKRRRSSQADATPKKAREKRVKIEEPQEEEDELLD
ncbi:hypothetical protein FRC03_005556 [Tulasnella sp. 419]|nr:hypothetical protein FRC03_005556 [Tulasnella sp. 419]